MTDHRHHDDERGHGHGHGHSADRGLSGALRYLRFAPQLWRSDVNDAVIELVDPAAGERVVDIGAGMGAGTVRAAQRGATVVAVEPTPFLRRVLAVRCRLHRARSRITVTDGSAERLPVTDRSVDAVWAVNTMHHWTDTDRGVAEIHRVLRRGGRMTLVDEDFEDPAHPEHERFGRRHRDDDHGFTMVDAAQMGDRLRAAGLIDVDATTRRLAGRPVIALTARASDAPGAAESEPPGGDRPPTGR